jgi:hypothetical protein
LYRINHMSYKLINGRSEHILYDFSRGELWKFVPGFFGVCPLHLLLYIFLQNLEHYYVLSPWILPAYHWNLEWPEGQCQDITSTLNSLKSAHDLTHSFVCTGNHEFMDCNPLQPENLMDAIKQSGTCARHSEPFVVSNHWYLNTINSV